MTISCSFQGDLKKNFDFILLINQSVCNDDVFTILKRSPLTIDAFFVQ